jgi:hypothetical protein
MTRDEITQYQKILKYLGRLLREYDALTEESYRELVEGIQTPRAIDVELVEVETRKKVQQVYGKQTRT